MSDQQSDYDEHGIRWVPTESLYAAPDVVPQQPPTNNLSDLRPAVERGEPLHWSLDQTGLAPDGSFAGQDQLRCSTVVIAPQLLRGDEHDNDEGA